MKRLFFTIITFCLLLGGCHTTDIGYLKATTASYPVSTMNVTHLSGVTEESNPELYAQYKKKIASQAPWTTTEMEGVLGTSPIHFSVAEVKALNGGDATIFQKELQIFGAGRMQLPFDFKAPKGVYSVSLQIENEGNAYRANDVFVFVVE